MDDSAVLTAELASVKGIDLYLELWKQGLDGKSKKLTHIDGYGSGASEKLDNWLLTNGTYFLLVGSKKSGKAFAWNVVDPYKLSFALRPGSNSTELEPNNDMRKANRPALDADIAATLDFGDEDWYQLDYSALAPGQTLDLDLKPSKTLETYWSVVTPDRQELLAGVIKKGQQLCIHSLGVPEDLDSLFVRLRAVENLDHSASYVLRAGRSAADLVQEREPNQDLDSVTPAPTPPFELTGALHDGDDRDCLLLPAAPQPLALQLETGPGLRARLELLNPDGGVAAAIQAGSAGEPIEIPSLPWAEGKPQALRIKGSGDTDCSATWKLKVGLAEVVEGAETEPNNAPTAPMDWASMPGKVQGWISWPGDRDCFVVPAALRLEAPEAPLHMMLSNDSDLGLELQVFSPDGVKLLDSLKVGAAAEKVLLPKDDKRPLKGRVLFCVQATKDSGARPRPQGYRLSLELGDPDPALDGR
jgi:hypothetical protein